jgi:hypothetical protein
MPNGPRVTLVNHRRATPGLSPIVIGRAIATCGAIECVTKAMGLPYGST